MGDKQGMKRGASSAPMSEDQVDEFKDVFELFDVSRSGYLTKDDLKQVCSQFGVRLATDDLDSMFKEADVLGKGKVGFPEFMSLMGKKMSLTSSENQLIRAFKAFDIDDDGKIPTQYLTEQLTTLGNPLSRKEMQTLIDIAENDHNEIVFQMFVEAMFSKSNK